jgi:hypothetical protein
VARASVWAGRKFGFIMGSSRRWSVESKVFELAIKGGNLGVRMVERSNGKHSSVFLLRDELVWMLGSMEVMERVGTSKVFWDQSRAGVPRIIVQQRANRNGRFLAVEEFDGRRRNGIILIPEGRQGQGWERLASELRLACSLLGEGRMFKARKLDHKPEKLMVGKRSFAEVVGTSKPSEEERFRALRKENDRNPSSGKEAPAAMGGHPPAKLYGDSEQGPAKNHSQTGPVGDLYELGGGDRPAGGSLGEKKRLKAVQWPEKSTVALGVTCTANQLLMKGREERALNAILELGTCREWLWQMRVQMDVGIERINTALKELEVNGPGPMDRVSKPTKGSMAKSSWIPKKGFVSGLGPTGKSNSIISKAAGDGVSVGEGLTGPDQGHSKSKLAGKLTFVSASPLPSPEERSDYIGPGQGLSKIGLMEKGSCSKGPCADPPEVPIGGTGLAISDTERSPEEDVALRNKEDGGDLGLQQVPSQALELSGAIISPMPIRLSGELAPSSKGGTLSVRGGGGKLGDRGLITRQSISWVAGRTGFGSATATGKDGDSFLLTGAQDRGGLGCSASTDGAQTMGVADMDRGTNIGMIGVERNNQVSIFKGGDLSLCCASVESDSPEGVDSVGGLEESGVAETVDGVGQGLVSSDAVGNSELVVSPTSEKMKTSVEVGNVIGLTCDGQEGMKVDCFKRIIMENQGRGDSFDEVFQQEEESGAQEGGNCSDYEA